MKKGSSIALYFYSEFTFMQNYAGWPRSRVSAIVRTADIGIQFLNDPGMIILRKLNGEYSMEISSIPLSEGVFDVVINIDQTPKDVAENGLDIKKIKLNQELSSGLFDETLNSLRFFSEFIGVSGMSHGRFKRSIINT